MAFNYKDNTYQLFEGEHVLIFDGTRSVGLYNYREDELMQLNLLTEDPPTVSRMEQKIKGVIQQYNNRMIADELTVGE